MLGDSVFRAVEGVDAQTRSMAATIAAKVASFPADLTNETIAALKRSLDVIVDRYYGHDRETARNSAVYRSIVYTERLAAIDEYTEQVVDFRAYVRGLGGETSIAIEQAMREYPDDFAELYFDFGGIPSRIEAARRAGLLDPQRRWVRADGYRLSDRVWRAGYGVRRAIDREIARAVRNGVGPETLARDLRTYLSPDFSPVRYNRDGSVIRIKGMPSGNGAGASAARRLARTEVQAIAHESTVLFVQDLPLTRKGVRWSLSPSHPRLDICDSYSRNSSPGYPRGVYAYGSVPKIPHPNCLCALRPWVGTRQQVIDELLSSYGPGPARRSRRNARSAG
jgi:hypothetical protein